MIKSALSQGHLNFIDYLKLQHLSTFDNILGMYIYGSVSYGDYVENISDIDILIVLDRLFTENELITLKKFYENELVSGNKLLRSFEIDYILLKDFSPNLSNTIPSIRLRGEKLKLDAEIEGASIDLKNIKDCGIILYGPHPKELIPAIPDYLLTNAINEKFLELKLHAAEWMKIDLWNQIFLVVQLCRSIYSVRNNNLPISKRSSAVWCLDNVPAKFRNMIKIAVDKIYDFDGPMEKEIDDNLFDFFDYTENLIKDKIKEY